MLVGCWQLFSYICCQNWHTRDFVDNYCRFLSFSMKMETQEQMKRDAAMIVSLLRQSEILGETVLRERGEMIEMDRNRQRTREALNELRRRKAAGERSAYVCFGNQFIKYEIDKALEMLKQEQVEINEKIETLRRQVKLNVQQLYELENRGQEVQIFNLNPLSSEEMKSFNIVLNQIHRTELSRQD